MELCTTVEQSRESKSDLEEATRVIMDLSDKKIDDVIEAVCEAAGISKEEVAAILALPPCETIHTQMHSISAETSITGSMMIQRNHLERVKQEILCRT